MNKKGFTLIELLATIALLAIVMVIVVPGVISLFNKAKEGTCDVQKKQIEVAAKMYLEDYCLNPIDNSYKCPLTRNNNNTFSGSIQLSTLEQNEYIENVNQAECKNCVVLFTNNVPNIICQKDAFAFEDANFDKCVVDAYNAKNDTNKLSAKQLTDEELETITSLNCNGYGKPDSEKIINTQGLEKLTALNSLKLHNNLIENIDVSKNTALVSIMINNNNLTSIDVSKNQLLETLYVNNNELTSLDVSRNTALVNLYAGNNNLTSVTLNDNIFTKTLKTNNNINVSFTSSIFAYSGYDSNIIDVSGGTITAKSVGTTTITATVTVAGTTKTYNGTITVTE